MVTVPSDPETTSRTAPVAVFKTDTLAFGMTAPVWSETATIIDAVLGDCAAVEFSAKNRTIAATTGFLKRILTLRQADSNCAGMITRWFCATGLFSNRLRGRC